MCLAIGLALIELAGVSENIKFLLELTKKEKAAVEACRQLLDRQQAQHLSRPVGVVEIETLLEGQLQRRSVWLRRHVFLNF